jgi:hypothetical protein
MRQRDVSMEHMNPPLQTVSIFVTSQNPHLQSPHAVVISCYRRFGALSQILPLTSSAKEP